jgi:hypothetical protein
VATCLNRRALDEGYKTAAAARRLDGGPGRAVLLPEGFAVGLRPRRVRAVVDPTPARLVPPGEKFRDGGTKVADAHEEGRSPQWGTSGGRGTPGGERCDGGTMESIRGLIALSINPA